MTRLRTKSQIPYNEKSYDLEKTDIEQPYISESDKINIGQKIELSSDRTNLPGWKIAQYYWNFRDETIENSKEVDKTYFTTRCFSYSTYCYKWT